MSVLLPQRWFISTRQYLATPLILLILFALLGMPIPATAGILDASWAAPTRNTDGTQIVDLAGYRIYYGALSRKATEPPCNSSFVDKVSGTSYELTGLSQGAMYYVQITTIDTGGNESACSAEVQGVARPDSTPPPQSTATLYVTKAGTGSGTVTSNPAGVSCGSDCSESYALNAAVILTAVPATGSTFTGWSGACTGTGSCALTMSQARTATATFAPSTTGGGGGPVAAYNFDVIGSSFTDVSGHGQTGTVQGATWKTGKNGNALAFDGVKAWATVRDSAVLDLTTRMTVMAWVFPTASSGWRSVVVKEASGTLAYGLYASNGTQPVGDLNVGGIEVMVTGATALRLNTWSHLAMTYDGATLRLYVNGALAGSRAASGSVVTSAGALRLGGNAMWGEYFRGTMDEVRLYNRALSQSEIQVDMATALR